MPILCGVQGRINKTYLFHSLALVPFWEVCRLNHLEREIVFLLIGAR